MKTIFQYTVELTKKIWEKQRENKFNGFAIAGPYYSKIRGDVVQICGDGEVEMFITESNKFYSMMPGEICGSIEEEKWERDEDIGYYVAKGFTEEEIKSFLYKTLTHTDEHIDAARWALMGELMGELFTNSNFNS